MEETNTILCGSQPFWDLDLTWNTNLPSLTRCFRRTTFSLIPNSLLWVVFPFYLYNLRQRTLATNAKMSLLSIVKILLAGILVLLAILDLAFWALNDQMIGLDLFEAAVRIVTFLALIVIVKFEVTHGARISKVQFLFLTLLVPCHAMNSYCEVMDHFFKIPDVYDQLMPVITSLLTLAFVVASFTSHFFVDVR